MPGEYQEEFFKEFQKEKSKFQKITDKMVQRQRRLYTHMSLENIVVAAIIAIMCLIVAFAFGVERGKKLISHAPQKVEIPYREKEIAPQEMDKPYTIQLISYAKEERAEKEKNKLLKKNIYTFIIQSGKWYQVCAGGYADIKEAKAALEEFSKDYKGCFIRKGAK